MSSLASVFLTVVSIASVIGILFVVVALVRKLHDHRMRVLLKGAKEKFHLRREWLEAKFLTAASKSGKPRGLDWKDCEFHNEVAFARDRHTGQLCALVGVAIEFEAVEGGGMEDNLNVGNLKAGSAVFRFDGRHWSTDGRALLNLDPDEAIQRLQSELETVD